MSELRPYEEAGTVCYDDFETPRNCDCVWGVVHAEFHRTPCAIASAASQDDPTALERFEEPP